MKRADHDPSEQDRLAALHAYEILDSEREEGLDDIVALAAQLTGSPIALVSLVDAERQWFKARYGIDATESERQDAFCAYAIRDPASPLIVPDAREDVRFFASSLVTGPTAIRAYLGMPLVTPEGHALGTLCVLDRVPRPAYAQEVGTLKTLARAVSTNFELRRSHLRFSKVAHTDPLTGLPNRGAMMAALSDRLGRGMSLAVILIDLDYFKEVNDGHGHTTGDLLLQEIAGRLRQATRQGDLAARIGGDEFALLLTHVSDRAVAAEVAGRIAEVVARPIPYDGGFLRVGATLGVAVAPADADDADMIVRAADEALLTAKRNGRGGIGQARRQDVERVRRAAAIFRAFDLDRGENGVVHGAVPYLQPIVQVGDGPPDLAEPIAFEVLTRWSAPGLGQIPPDELFAVIGPERASLISGYVRALAMAEFAALRRAGLTEARLAINLSMGEVLQADIATRIETEMLSAGLSLKDLEIEITEEVLFDRVSDTTLRQLLSLQLRGARMILDDFGIANSGLAQLMRMKLDGVKLDKQFVLGLGRDERAEAIVHAAISVAHSLGLHIVAEGVETEGQLATLASLECDAAQGYLYSRPMPCRDVEAFLWSLREKRLELLQ